MESIVKKHFPKQSTMLLPLLQMIDNAGGMAKPGELYDQMAAHVHLESHIRDATVKAGTREARAWDRHVRWTRQTAVMRRLIDAEQRGVWGLTSKARTRLKEIVRGKIITVFETDAGIVLWANAEDAMGAIERSSVDLLWTSPPYPLQRPKEYGNLDEREWVDWMLRLCEGWQALLSPTGSMMLNLGPCWIANRPQQSLYVERLLIQLEDQLGLHLLQRLDWFNPNRLPGPMEWVCIRRVRVKAAVQPILWLSPDPLAAKANNRHVLQPYTESGRRAIARSTQQNRRPSGFQFGARSFVDVGGSIPPSLIIASNCSSNDAYQRAERAAGRNPHPATAPEAIVDFGVRLATDEGDLVYDPLAGSCVTGIVAQRLRRRFICNDRSRTFIESGRLRFESAGFRTRLFA